MKRVKFMRWKFLYQVQFSSKDRYRYQLHTYTLINGSYSAQVTL
jgi:hypothetical protein